MNCEQVRIAAMAFADGESPPLSRAAIAAHVAECAACRQEIGELQRLGRLWEAQERQTHTVDLWPQMKGRLDASVKGRIWSRGARPERRWLPTLVVMLVVFKLIEFIPDRGLGTWVQFIPLLLAAAVFVLVGQNPFQIKTELRSREESK